MSRNTALGIGLAIFLSATAAFLLMRLLQAGGKMPGVVYFAIGLGVVAGITGLVMAITRPRPGRAEQAEQQKRQSKSAVIAGVTTAVSAQLVAIIANHGEIIPRTLNGIGNGEAAGKGVVWPILAGAVIFVLGIIFVIAATSTKKGKRGAAASPVHIPWVFALIIGMLILGVVSIAMGLAIGSEAGAQSSDMAWLLVALAVTILVFVFVIKILVVGSRFSAYALPDALPAAGPPTDPRFHRGGYYDGTKLLNKRVWGMPVQVMGRGYFIRGHGKAWLADEVLAFHLYLTRNPLAIPYGVIHAVNTKNLMLVKNRLPGPGMSIIWGRPDMPMVTTIQVTPNKAENEAWAQEIMRRAGVWKDKMAATQAAQAQ